ncbi:MAG: NUDIX domain-containing protein [Candidatus Moraniibacteriota bacterium]
MNTSDKDRPKVGIGIIVMRAGKILIGERLSSHGAQTFQSPGGHLEFGESFEETAMREVEEETGLKDIIIKGVVSIGNDRAYDKHYVSIGILAESLSGNPYDAEPHGSKNWQWIDPADVPDNTFLPSKKVIQNWMNGTVYSD